MTVIHFIRHGEVLNPDDLYYGRLPGFPLTDQGRECIAYMAKQLAVYPIQSVYHSPLLRTTQTAEILASELHVPLHTDDRLLEIKSLFEGHKRVKAATVPYYPVTKLPYAETPGEIYDRMAHFVHDVAQLHGNAHVAAVSHNGPLHILELGLSGRSLSDLAIEADPIPTCGLELVVTVHGDTVMVKRHELSCPVPRHRQ